MPKIQEVWWSVGKNKKSIC